MANADKKVTVGNLSALYKKLVEKFMPNQTPQELRAAMGLGDTLGPLSVEHGGTGAGDFSGFVSQVNGATEAASGMHLFDRIVARNDYSATLPVNNGNYIEPVAFFARSDGSHLAFCFGYTSSTTKSVIVSGTTKFGASVSKTASFSTSAVTTSSHSGTLLAYAMNDNADGSFTGHFAFYAYFNGYLGQYTVTVKVTASGSVSASAAKVSESWDSYRSHSPLFKGSGSSYSHSFKKEIAHRGNDGSWHRIMADADYKNNGRIHDFVMTADGVFSVRTVTFADYASVAMPGTVSSYPRQRSACTGEHVILWSEDSSSIASFRISGDFEVNVAQVQGSYYWKPAVNDLYRWADHGSDVAANGSSLYYVKCEIGEEGVTYSELPGAKSSTALALTPSYSSMDFFCENGSLYAISLYDSKVLVVNCDTGAIAQDVLRTRPYGTLPGGYLQRNGSNGLHHFRAHDGGDAVFVMQLDQKGAGATLSYSEFALEVDE